MKYVLKVFLMIMVGLMLQASISNAMEDAIVAIVNDEILTLRDLKDYIHSTYVGLVAEGRSEREMQALMQDLEVNGLNKLIEDKLILSAANKLGLEVKDALIDQRVDTIKKKYPSERAFMDALIVNGATLGDLRKKVLNQLKIQFVVEHEIKSKLHVNPQEVTDFYEANGKDFVRKERVYLESIYIAFKNDKEGAMRRMRAAIKKIEAGEDFLLVAKEYSDTPSIGVIERGQILPEIEEAVFVLEGEDVSAPVEVEGGVYVFKLTGRMPERVAPLHEVKEDITNLLYKMKFNDLFGTWLAKLKEEAYIEVKK